jgi:hypothetical protein
MSRERLPTRRAAVTETITLAGGQRIHVTAGFAPDGRLLEVFLRGAKSGSDRDHLLDDAAVCLSRLLQHGDSLTAIAAGIGRQPDNAPSSMIGVVVDRLLLIEAGIWGDRQ